MVRVEALLKLAHWCQQRRQLPSGREPCTTSRKTEFPPAPASGGDVCRAVGTLDSSHTDDTSERPSNTEPDHRSAATEARDGAGGAA